MEPNRNQARANSSYPCVHHTQRTPAARRKSSHAEGVESSYGPRAASVSLSARPDGRRVVERRNQSITKGESENRERRRTFRASPLSFYPRASSFCDWG